MRTRWVQLRKMDDYYTGLHPMPFLTKAHDAKMRNEFRQLLQQCRSNFMRLVVDAVEERMQIEGIRLSAQSTQQSDELTWKIWQANNMDSDSQVAMVESLIKGVSYLSVWPGDPYPTIAVEDALETIVAYTAGVNFRRRDAALKMWQDEWTGDLMANVYMPDGIYKFTRPGSQMHAPGIGTGAGEMQESEITWVPLDTADQFVPNPFNIVPIIPLRNRPRLLLEGESELVDLTGTQDRINGTLFMRCLAGYMGAHRQRWAVGLTLMEDENTGKPVEPFDVAIDKLWQHEDPDVKFGEFSQTDLTGYISSIEQDVLHVAVTSRTPRHYLFNEGQSPSGDAIQSAEAGLVKKCIRKSRPWGEGFEETLGIARQMSGQGAPSVDAEIIWSNPEVQTEAEITDAAIKQFQAGLIPIDAALAKLGYSQTEIARFAALRAQDQMMQALLNPAPATGGDQEQETEPGDAQDAPAGS